MATFILQHRTPRQVRFLPASEVQGNGKGGFSHRPLRRTQETLNFTQVMGAISACMRGKGVRNDLLEVAFNEAQQRYPQLMTSATFSPRQANGRPPVVIIKD